MTGVPRPEREPARLDALRDLAILDTLPEDAYDDVTRIAAELCDAPVALVSLVDEDRQWFKSKVGLDLVETPREHAFCAHAIVDPDRVMVVEDASADPRFAANPFVTAPDGIRFYAGAPLVMRDGHALGTLCVIDRKPRSLSAVQLETLRALSRQVVAHLELRRLVRQLERSRDELAGLCDALERQAEAVDRDLHRAALIQRSLLPRRMPALGNCCVQSLYRPGRSVGGDLFDVVRIDGRHLALVVADAAGHGPSAALLALLFRHHLRLVDADGCPVRPADALGAVNDGLRANGALPGMFVTAIVALLDLEERELRIASAGHPPALWLRAAGAPASIGRTGPALGLVDAAVFEEQRLRLAEGDRVLLHTDGLLDWGAAGPVTVAELGAAVLRIGRRPDALEVLCGELAAGGAAPDRDDVTALLLDLGPGESRCLEPAELEGTDNVAAARGPRIRHGETADATYIALGGRVTWQYADALREAALAVLEAHRPLVFDLADCEQLDSTVLGTLHELVGRADALGVRLALQGVSERLDAAFAELCLDAVRAHVTPTAAPLPEPLAVLEIDARDLRRHRERLVRAHEALAGLSERNRELFADVVDALRDG